MFSIFNDSNNYKRIAINAAIYNYWFNDF